MLKEGKKHMREEKKLSLLRDCRFKHTWVKLC